MEHLALEVFDRDGSGSKYAFLPSDTSITITDTSEIFDSGDIWSHAFKLNIPANAHIFGSAGEMHGSRLHEQIDKRRARLWVEGLPLYYGYLRLDDEVDVDEYGDVNVSFESGRKTFHDMIDGAKANQVPLMDDVMIGMALKRERKIERRGAGVVVYRESSNELLFNLHNVTLKGELSQDYPKYVVVDSEGVQFTDPSGYTYNLPNRVNTSTPYDSSHPYCNNKICYSKKEWESKDGSIQKKDVRGFVTSGANRINSAPNFFVLYWLDCLMKHLGIHVEENQMMDIEDMRRLFFVNTRCAYKTKDDEGEYKRNKALPTGRHSPFVTPWSDDEESMQLSIEKTKQGSANLDGVKARILLYGSDVNDPWDAENAYNFEYYNLDTTGTRPIYYPAHNYYSNTDKWKKAYATSDNFPNVDINDVVDAINAGFGVRFLFNDDYTKVRIVLLRNVLRSNEVQEFPCDITEVTKQENSIRGFRLTYGGSDDDTNFNYKGFAQAKIDADGGWVTEAELHDYSQWNTGLNYLEIVKTNGNLNKTCYIDLATGNSYIFKIDKDGKEPAEWFTSLFECAQYMDAEDGDCSGDEETIKEVRVGFTPGTMTDTNPGSQDFYLFVDETMGVPATYNGKAEADAVGSYVDGEGSVKSSVEQNLDSTSYSVENVEVKNGLFELATRSPIRVYAPDGSEVFGWDTRDGSNPTEFKISGWIREGYRLYLHDNYDFNDEMDSPLDTHDWGLTLCIMRGAGTNERINYSIDATEDEGNDYWERSGTGCIDHPDTCDNNGTLWNADGGSASNRISLKLRAEKPNPDFDPTLPEGHSEQSTTKMVSEYSSVAETAEEAELVVQKYYNDILSMFRKQPVGCNTLVSNGWTSANAFASLYSKTSMWCVVKRIRLHDTQVQDSPWSSLSRWKKQYAIFILNAISLSGGIYSPTELDQIVSLVNNTKTETIAATSYTMNGIGGKTISEVLQALSAYGGIVVSYMIVPQTPYEMQDNYIQEEEKDELLRQQKEAEMQAQADVLNKLSGLYCANPGDTPPPVTLPAGYNFKREREVTTVISTDNQRYLQIANPALRRRGLADRFYKEYSYWVRNARIVKMKVRAELAQLIGIDKTKRVHIGEITGFLKKIQYSIDIQSGLGLVELELWYL